MVSAENACRPGRGIPYYTGISIASAALTNLASVTVIEADLTDFIVVDALWFDIPNDVTAYDLLIQSDDYFGGQAGTPSTIAKVELPLAADVGDLRALWDWENPNPPTGHYQGIMKIPNLALAPDASQTDKVTIIGDHVTDANNYTSTGATAMAVVARTRKVAANAFV